VPIGYHGRASSIVASGSAFHRPRGQFKLPDKEMPEVGPSRRLDYELEVAVLIGRANPQGEPVPIEHADDHVFGLGLFNDWTARDIQAWEYQPLGPFLSKNFASTLSPWIVTLDALAPFRVPYERPAEDPSPLPYLDSPANTRLGAFDITLEVWLQKYTFPLEARYADVDYAREVYADLVDNLLANGTKGYETFLLDLESGGPTELDTLSGAVSRLAAQAGIDTPVHDTATAALGVRR